MERYLKSHLIDDLNKKIIIMSGPRQSGKTTITRSLFKDYEYFNYDFVDDRLLLTKRSWRREVPCLIFDEIHKMPEWKRWLKGIYDTGGNLQKIIVTGSANLEAFTNIGDSLAGRYFHYRMHPIDIKEAVTFHGMHHEEAFKSLLMFSGFPEPFLEQSIKFYRKWQRTHMDVILRQDFLDLYALRSILKIELLVEMLKSRIASSISYASLAGDLQVDPKSVQNWLQLLENFFVLFKITPYHRNVARSLLKEPKYYFFDIGRVINNGAKLENLVALALLKEVHFLQDTEGLSLDLYYLKNKEGAEVDFIITLNHEPLIAFEVKASDNTPSKSFRQFKKSISIKTCIQLVANLDREFDSEDGVMIRHLSKFLSRLDLRQYM